MELEREMAISRDEFLRVLPRALPDAELRVNGDYIECRLGERSAGIALSSLGERRIGALRLPSTLVRISLAGFDREAAREFLQRFDSAFHRGGG